MRDTPNAPPALSAEERDPETVAPGEEFDALVESMIGALQLHGWDAERAREWPFISLPDYANDMANRLGRVEEENASLTAALLAARRGTDALRETLQTIITKFDAPVPFRKWERDLTEAVYLARAALAATQETRNA